MEIMIITNESSSSGQTLLWFQDSFLMKSLTSKSFLEWMRPTDNSLSIWLPHHQEYQKGKPLKIPYNPAAMVKDFVSSLKKIFPNYGIRFFIVIFQISYEVQYLSVWIRDIRELGYFHIRHSKLRNKSLVYFCSFMKS